MFNLKLQQTPLINLRLEVANYLGLFKTEEFCRQFYRTRYKNDAINTVYDSWYGRKEVLATQILRSMILDIESAITSCVYFSASIDGKLNDEVKEAVNDPFILKGKGTVENLYHKLPALINEKYSLLVMNVDLYNETKTFYKEVRNPIMHGKELFDIDINDIKNALEFILKLFNWIDAWFNINSFIENGLKCTEIPEYKKFINQIVANDFISENMNSELENYEELDGIADINGTYITDCIEFDLQTIYKKTYRLKLSAKCAMKMLVFLAKAKEAREWPIPERV